MPQNSDTVTFTHTHTHSHIHIAHIAVKRGGIRRKRNLHQPAHECNLKDFTQQKAKGKKTNTQKKHRTQKNPHTYKLKNKEIHAPPHSLFLHPVTGLAPPQNPEASNSLYPTDAFTGPGSSVQQALLCLLFVLWSHWAWYP